jgi:hypothetical protein
VCPHRGCAVRVQVVAQKTEESDMADNMLLLVSLLALLRFDFVRFSRVRAALQPAPYRIGVFDRDVLLEFFRAVFAGGFDREHFGSIWVGSSTLRLRVLISGLV